MPRVFRTISFRLTALYLLLFTASAVTFGVFVFWTTSAALERQLTIQVQREITHLTDVYENGGLPRLIDAAEVRGRGLGALDYLVQAPDGTRLAGELPDVANRCGWLQLDVNEERYDNGPKRVRAFAKELPGAVVIAVGDDLRHVDDAEEAVLSAFAWAIAATLLLGAGGGLWLSQLFLRRVDAISRTAEAIIGGDLTKRIPVRRTGDDIDRLAATLNRMLDQISALMESVREASNNIAHDLRTPLSRLGQRLQEARAHLGSVAEYEQELEAANEEVEALLETFASMLRIAEVEAGAQRAAFRTMDLSAIAETVAEAFMPSAEVERHSLLTEIAPRTTVFGDKDLLTQMLVNLVENALRHTPPHTCVKLQVSSRDARPVLVVEDSGPGIPEAEREQVLRRFYRLDRSRTTPGTGLGLSLVRAVVALHGAELSLGDAHPGLRVTVTFPFTP